MAANLTAFQLFQISEGTAARRKLIIKMVDATDGFTEETGITFGATDIKISKNGGTFVDATNSAATAEVAFGSYVLDLTAAELNTIGTIEVRAIEAGSRTFYAFGQIVGFDIFDTTPDIGNVISNVKGDVEGDVLGETVKIGSPALTDIEDQILDADLTSHNAVDSVGQRLTGLAPVNGAVSDGGPTSTDFDTNLSQATDDHWNDQLLVMTSGSLAGQAALITDYDGTGKNLIFTPAFTAAPSDLDRFVIVAISPSNVLTETITELAAVPGKEPNIRDLLAWVYMVSRNKLISDSNTNKAEVHDDAGSKIADAALTDAGGIFTRGEYS